MAALILPRRFYEQPQGTVAIDDNGPNVACIIPSLFMQELVSQAALSSVGTKQAATNSLDRDGVLYDFDGTTLSALSLPRPRIYTADKPFSFAWRGAIRSTGTNGLLFGEFNTLNSWVRVDDGGNRIIFTNASGTSTVLSNAFGGEVNSWVLTSDGGGTGASTLRLYKNGVLVVTSAGTITPTFTLDSIGCAYNSASFAYNGTLLYFFAWDRQLRAQDAVEIHENPWQLFRATPRRIYFDVGAGSGQTITPSKGSASTTGYQPSVSQSITVSPAAAHVSATGYTPSVSQAAPVFLRPDSNVTQTSFTGGFAEIDETAASDADFAYGTNNTAATLEVGLSNPSGAPGSGTTTVRYRIAKTNAGVLDGGGNAVTVTASLYQGATLISADAAQTTTGTWTDYSWTPDVSGVTDWNDLRLRFVTSASGGTAANRRGGAVSWAELQAPAVSGAGQTISPSKGAVTATGRQPTVSQPVTASPSVGHAVATGYAPTVSQSQTVAPSVAHLAATGYQASIDQPRTIAPSKGAVSAAGYAPTIDQSAGQTVAPAVGHVSASGYAPSVSQPITVSPAKVSAAITGYAPDVSQDASVTVSPAKGRAQATGYAPTIAQPISVSPSVGHALLTGNQPIIVQGVQVYPAAGRISATGYAPTISRPRTITLTSGAARITGRAPTISQGIEIYSSLRTLAIAAENRIRGVSAENRIHPTSAEDRDLPQ